MNLVRKRVKPAARFRVPYPMKPKPPKPGPPDAQTLAEARARSRQIAKMLHLAFDDVTREPVPSEFLDLLRQLDEREPKLKHN